MFILLANGYLYTSGDGRHGKLGFGLEDFSNIFTFTKLEHLCKLNIKQVSEQISKLKLYFLKHCAPNF